MTLALVNHAADNVNTLRVWVGIAHGNVDQNLLWKINGKAAQPSTLRALSSWQVKDGKPFRSGVFEFNGLNPASPYDVELSVGAEKIARVFTTMQATVPSSRDASFNLLLLSCFHGSQDARGNGGRVLSTLKPRPDLSIFAGDQVYLDLPTLRDFEDDQSWLEDKFMQDYLANWFGSPQAALAPHEIPLGFPQILSLAPIVTIPDDHEYWNNAPFSSPFIQNTWTENGRKNWRNAAERGFGMFQNGTAQPMGVPRQVSIDPLSILILDTRSQRNLGKGAQPDSATMRNAAGDLLGPQGRIALTKWANDLIATAKSATPRYGALVTGQSLFTKSAGTLKGSIADFEFPDYPEDYQFLITEIERVSRAGLPVLCLTGDVHWGRIICAAAPSGSAPIYEVISSPTSLVESIGADQLANAVSGIKSLFGKSDPWPRHPDPEPAPQRFGTRGAYATDFLRSTSGKQTAMRGNMVLMLRFRTIGPALNVDVEYIPLHEKDAINARDGWTTNFRLRPLN